MRKINPKNFTGYVIAEVAIVEDLCQLVEIAVSVLQPQPTESAKSDKKI